MRKRIISINLIAMMLLSVLTFAGCGSYDDIGSLKAAGKAEIDAHVATKVEADYSVDYDDYWMALSNAAIAGKAAVDEAINEAEINSAVAAAKNAIDAVEKWKLDIANVTDIRIDIKSVKTHYGINEDLDLSGLAVKAKMNDDTLITLRNWDFEIDESAYDKSESGVYRIKISVGEFKANFFVMNSITLEEKEPWDGDINEWHTVFHGRLESQPRYADEGFFLVLDNNCRIDLLTIDDFKMFDNLANIVQRGTNVYLITIKNQGRDNVLEEMRKIEMLDFVKGSIAMPYHCGVATCRWCL